MKIVVVKASGEWYCKPDNTLNHNNSDYYCPEGVVALEAVPCIYTHIDKAGKCVARRFAGRYWSRLAFGLMLVDRSATAESAMASAMDFTSVLDMAWQPDCHLVPGQFALEINGEQRYRLEEEFNIDTINDAICRITARTSLRIGDIVAIEAGSGFPAAAGDTLTRIVSGERISIKIY